MRFVAGFWVFLVAYKIKRVDFIVGSLCRSSSIFLTLFKKYF
nr:MAG TPA: hypothetical protein [Caudoviricetes sp.]